MTFHFDLPVGVHTDLKELEYISALHQTGMPNLRKDGSIKVISKFGEMTDIDISSFLASRYSIHISPEEVRESIINGLGGGDDDEDCIDLMEIVAILIIPSLIKASNQLKRGESNYDLENQDQDIKIIEDTEKSFFNKQDMTVKESLEPPKGLIKYVLNMILHDMTDSTEPKKLDKHLLKLILKSYGETYLARDDKLLNDMLEIARAGMKENNGEQILMLNENTFGHALTSDVSIYDVNHEFSVQTVFDDVFGNRKDIESTYTSSSHETDNVYVAKRTTFYKMNWLLRPVDFVAETYSSKIIVVFSWATFIFFAFPFAYFDVKSDCASWGDRHFGCDIAVQITSWIAKIVISMVGGFLFLSGPNIGNYVDGRQFLYPLVGIFIAIGAALIFYQGIWGDQIKMFFHQFGLIYLSVVTSFMYFLITCIHIKQIIFLVLPSRIRKKYPKLFAGNGIKMESSIKRAASYKIKRMITNALAVTLSIDDGDNVIDTFFGQALLVHSKMEENSEKAGGVFWTVKKMWNKSLYEKEGIWVHSSLQVTVLTCITLIGLFLNQSTFVIQSVDEFYSTPNVTAELDHFFDKGLEMALNTRIFDSFNDVTPNISGEIAEFVTGNLDTSDTDCTEVSPFMFDSLNQTSSISRMNFSSSCPENTNCSLFDQDFLCRLAGVTTLSSINEEMRQTTQQNLLESVGLQTSTIKFITQDFNETLRNAIRDYYPERNTVKVPIILGTLVGISVFFCLALYIIPSASSTILKLRSGIIPTFHDPQFFEYRVAQHTSSLLIGSLFFGSIVSSVIFGVLIMVISFLILWQGTRNLMIQISTVITGFLITLIFQQLLVSCIEKMSSSRAFYRQSPGRATLWLMMLTCARFPLSVYFAFVRLIKLILIGILYVGRMDQPLLAPGVGKFGPLMLDTMPFIFMKELLSTEAHRHPYISLMGTFYLMKLRHGSKFASKAGSTWRLIFVLALFPWMSKYRILTRPEKFEEIGEDRKPKAREFVERALDDLSKSFKSLRTPDIDNIGNPVVEISGKGSNEFSENRFAELENKKNMLERKNSKLAAEIWKMKVTNVMHTHKRNTSRI